MNRICIVGRLTRDPEMRVTTTGKSYATFSVAVNKKFKPQDPNERDADFFNVKVWDKTAEYVTNYLAKGRLVSVDGRIESRRYTDQQGVQKEIWEIAADNVNGLDRPRDDAGGAPAPSSAPAGNQGSYGSAPRPSRGTAPAENEYDPFADE